MRRLNLQRILHEVAKDCLETPDLPPMVGWTILWRLRSRGSWSRELYDAKHWRPGGARRPQGRRRDPHRSRRR